MKNVPKKSSPNCLVINISNFLILNTLCKVLCGRVINRAKIAQKCQNQVVFTKKYTLFHCILYGGKALHFHPFAPPWRSKRFGGAEEGGGTLAEAEGNRQPENQRFHLLFHLFSLSVPLVFTIFST